MVKIKVSFNIKAILFNVDESILDNLKIGNNYNLIKDSLTNSNLYDMLDCTMFGIRRKYELSKINDNLDVIILSKETCNEYKCKIVEGEGIFINGKDLDDFIYDYECQEMYYINSKLRLLRLYNDNYIKIKELYIKTTCKIDDKPEFNHISLIPFDIKIEDDSPKMFLNSSTAKSINKFISDFDLNFAKTNFNKELLIQAVYLLDQSYYAHTNAMRFLTCIIGLEALLLKDNNNITDKLRRNIAVLLSNNKSDFYYYSDTIRDLYDKRSRFIHDGNVSLIDNQQIELARDILRKVIFKIVELDMSKSNLLKYLDERGISK